MASKPNTYKIPNLTDEQAQQLAHDLFVKGTESLTIAAQRVDRQYWIVRKWAKDEQWHLQREEYRLSNIAALRKKGVQAPLEHYAELCLMIMDVKTMLKRRIASLMKQASGASEQELNGVLEGISKVEAQYKRYSKELRLDEAT